jgi:hypothetical protein
MNELKLKCYEIIELKLKYYNWNWNEMNWNWNELKSLNWINWIELKLKCYEWIEIEMLTNLRVIEFFTAERSFVNQ